MTDQFPATGPFLRPEEWPYWMPDTLLGRVPVPRVPSSDVWKTTPPAGPDPRSPSALNGGLLGNLAANSVSPSNGGILGNLLPPVDASTIAAAELPSRHAGQNPAASNNGYQGPFWLQTIAPFGAAEDTPAGSGPAIDRDPFDLAAARTSRSVRPQRGRQEGTTTRLLETYVPHAARGLADLITLPGRDPVPMPKGLQVNDAGEWLINGQPAIESPEGRAWLEDQQRRMDWGPATALLLASARAPRGARTGSAGTPATRGTTPAALREPLLQALEAPAGPLPQPLQAPAVAPTPGRLFDYSRLHETPDVPQFDLERYVPPRGAPERIQALAHPANIERVNEAVRRGAELGGRDFYNTEQLRQAFIGELGPEKGQAAYDKYLNLVGATSPGSKVGENIRNAAYHYMRSQQGFPPPITRWEGGRWRLAEPVPPPWGHIEQALHAKKIKEALEQGGLSPLTNPKTASFVQNLRGNQTPITIDRHNARLLGVTNGLGHSVDVPPRTGYGFLERLQQQEAAKQGMTPAQYQASGWIGGAEQTGVRSKLTPWLDSLEARIRLTAKKRGLDAEEMLRRFIRGELPLRSIGGASTAGATLRRGDEAQE